MAAELQSPYQRLGGEAGVRLLVNTFYDLVESRPEGQPLRVMHNAGSGLAHVRETQFMFLSGFLGGPQLYAEQFRHANVRQMHAHLAISEAEAKSWLACMDMALQKVADDDTRRLLMTHFTRVANALKTAPQDAGPLRVTSN